jgi:benzoate/toluate 1,2-dioxygenase reductase subunit
MTRKAMPHITLIFEDGRSIGLQASSEETIYAAALRNKLRLESDCLEGACATCKGLCSSGEYRLGDYSEDALSDEEAAARQVLTCQMRASSDCVIELPYASTQALGKAGVPVQRLAMPVTGLETVAEGVVRLTLGAAEAGAAAMQFLPGQYVHLQVPGSEAQRSYSFSNAPVMAGAAAGSMEFYIKLLPSGEMSDYLRQRAAVGDRINMSGPFGRFYLRPPQRPILMVAGGTGLAPMLSMLRSLLAQQQALPPIHLLYGAASSAEFCDGNSLQDLMDQGLPLTVQRIAVGDGPGQGHVTSLLRPELLHANGSDVYLCGPPPMIEAAQSWLRAQGVPATQVYAEKFLPS